MKRYRRTARMRVGAATALRRQNRRLREENRRLRESRRRYRRIFSHARVVLWEEDFSAVQEGLEELKEQGVSDFDSYFDLHPEKAYELMRRIRVLDVNPAGPELFRAPDKEHLLGSLEKMFVSGSFPFLKEELIAVAEGRDHVEGETVGKTFDGQTLHLLVTIDFSPAGPRYQRVMVSMMDITPRIRKEEERDRLMRGLQAEKLNSEILREITIALTSRLDQSSILDTILGQAARLVPFDSGNIRTLEGEYLQSARWFGYEEYGAEEFMAGFREHIDDLGLAREVIDRGKPVIIDNAAADERFVHFPETSYIRSVLVMPISTARKLYGLLTIESASTGMYGREEQEKLKPLADAAAIALEKAELYEELRAELEEKKRIEERLEHSLAKKDTLLREIHHRVKNNLAMVVSLINLQSSQVVDETAGEVLEHIRSKIYSISLIHEKLYRSDDLQHIVLSEYVHDLLQTLRSTVVDEGDVAVENRVSGELVVDIERAIPLALIITELFTNSYKYGCRETCRFLVRGSADGDDAELRIEDNGPGFPEGFSMEDGDTLGLMLVQSLAEQLAGSARIGDRRRAEIIIRFPLPREPAEAAGSPGSG